MKQLPDDKTLLKLLELAQEAEQTVKELCDLTAAIDEKWRIRLESKKTVTVQTASQHELEN